MNIIPEFSSAPNETYHGLILTLQDALLLLEGTRRNLLPKVKRRLSDFERKHITAGSVFAWNETELGMKRWTDGKYWLALKVKGPFLIYQELDVARNLKINGLVKQSFLLTTKQGEKLHLIAYYNPEDRAKDIPTGTIPSQDPLLQSLLLDPAVYLNDFLQYNTSEVTVMPQLYPVQGAVPYPQAHYVEQRGSMSAGLVPQPVQTHYFQPIHPTYYCHPLLMPYQYQQQQQHPYMPVQQQQIYMQPVSHHVPSYAEQVAMGQVLGPPFHAGPAATPAAANPAYHHMYAHLLPPTASLSTRGSLSSAPGPAQLSVPTPPRSGSYSVSPANGMNKAVESPAFTYAVKKVSSLLLLPLPKLAKLTPQTLPSLPDLIMKFDKISTIPLQPIRLPQTQQQLCVQYHPDVRNKLNELDKAFSV